MVNEQTTLAELARLGRGLGAVRWAQGPGGNVSVKTSAGELWVKASGRRLADVAEEGGHVRVPLALARRAAEGDLAADALLFAYSPRPSLETYMHALGGAVVAHTHCAGSLLLACSTNRTLLPDFAIGIDYVRPGRDLEARIREASSSVGLEAVFLLRSHGLLVFAPTAERALALTASVDRAGIAAFDPPSTVESHVDAYLDMKVTAAEGLFVADLPARVPAPASYLFPDAVIYATTVHVPHLRQSEALARAALAELGRPAVLEDDTGARVAFASSRSKLRDCIEVLAVHDWVQDTLARGTGPELLDAAEPAALVSMPSEKYRMQLDDAG